MLNDFVVEGDVCRIIIFTKAGARVETIIDIEDMPKAAEYRWHAAKQGDTYRIVCHKRLFKGDKKRGIYLHRVVTDATQDVMVDHINCNPLDNRKCNLRFVDFVANGQNRAKLHPTNTSGVRNVTWHKRDERWQAVIYVGGKRVFLGYFKEIEDASAAVEQARADMMPFSQEAMRRAA